MYQCAPADNKARLRGNDNAASEGLAGATKPARQKSATLLIDLPVLKKPGSPYRVGQLLCAIEG